MSHHILKKLTILLGLALIGGLTSCATIGDTGPPYGSYQRPYSTSSYGYGRSSFGYGGPSPYYGYGHSRYDHRRDDDRIKLTAGRQSSKPNRPEGYHTREWYERRGYDLERFKHKHEDSGNSHKGEDYRASSSSSRQRSSSSSDSRRGSSSSSDSRRGSSSSSRKR